MDPTDNEAAAAAEAATQKEGVRAGGNAKMAVLITPAMMNRGARMPPGSIREGKWQ